MSSSDKSQFPEAFNHLETFSNWVVDGEIARRNKCASSSMEEIRKFYDGMLDAMDDVLGHLNKFSLEDLPGLEKNLLALVLVFVEAAICVEMFGQPEIDFGMSIERFEPLHHLVP